MTITVDSKICSHPLQCRICLDRCPKRVFGTYPQKQRQPGFSADDWVIIPLFNSLCNECRECLSFCPKRAIAISSD